MNEIPPTGACCPLLIQRLPSTRDAGRPGRNRRRAGVVCYNPTRTNFDQPGVRQRLVQSVNSIGLGKHALADSTADFD